MKQAPFLRESKEHLVFVVHKHDATRLHYDFRLQVGNAMRSWAIPKGPTLDNTMKRLAMPTTDHDLDYRHFEGILPEGSYGAGTVMIWDEGYYVPEVELSKGLPKPVNEIKQGDIVMREGLKKGEVKFRLFGKKLHGSFALVKTKNFGPKDSWLLIKHKDRFVEKGYEANSYDFSAASERSLDEIAGMKE